MPFTDQQSVNKIFQNIVHLYEKQDFSSALEEIESTRDSLSESLNMKHQQQLNKMHASSAYHEIVRLYEEDSDAKELKDMIQHYSQMLEVHLNKSDWNHLLDLLPELNVASSSFKPATKHWNGISSRKSTFNSNVFLTGIFILCVIVLLILSFMFLRPKLATLFHQEDTSSPKTTVEENTKESSDSSKTTSKPVVPAPNNDATAQNVAPAPNNGATAQNVAPAPNNGATAQNAATAPNNGATAQNTATAPNNGATADSSQDYFLPSDTKILTNEDMATFDRNNINFAINEMFARHGYDFGKSGKYYDYFQKKSWYKVDTNIISPTQAENNFSDIEHKNLNFLLNYKKKK